jgi:hypothetical protein
LHFEDAAPDLAEDGGLFPTPLADDLPSTQQSFDGLTNESTFAEGNMNDASLDFTMHEDMCIPPPAKNETIPDIEEPKKSIRFADSVVIIPRMCMSESSLDTSLNLLGGGSSQSLDMCMPDSYFVEEDKEGEEEKKIKRRILYMAGGIGLFALVGWAFKSIFNRTTEGEAEDAANAAEGLTNSQDVASAVASSGDGGTSAATVAVQSTAEFVVDSSFTAQQSQQDMAFGYAVQHGGMSAAHTQVLHSMAVQAASSAAHSAASISTAMASTVAVGATAAAAATVAMTTVASVVSVLW